jgi:branched-chain amino acid transport system permease protein
VSNFFAFTIVGIVFGAVYAVVASGLVVTYTTSGIFNFAHGAIGMFMAFLYWELRVHRHWPAPIALVLVLLVAAPAFGALLERVLMRNLSADDTGTSLVVTLGLLLFLLGAAEAIWDPGKSRNLPEFFNGHHVRVGKVLISYGELTTIAVAIGVAVGLRLLFYRTRAGMTMRAVVDDRDLTALNGATPARVSQMSWALGSTLAAAAGILIAPKVGMEALGLTFLVVQGYAAAVVGRLKSLPMTFLGALILGLAFEYIIGYGSSLQKNSYLKNLPDVMPTLLLFAVLLVLPQVRLRAGRLTGGTTPAVPNARAAAFGGGALVIATIIAAALLTGSNLQHIDEGMAVSLIMLSLVLLTGYGGQVSLCQYTLAGFGAVAFGQLAHGGNPLVILAVAVICGAVGAIVALPALRLQGLYLALSTLAFAVLADKVYFSHVFGLGSLTIHRIALPGIHLTDRGQLVLLAVAFALLGMLVLAIRRGPFGRLLAAMRDSPAACATLGLDLTTTKLGVFALSAAMAGVAGALYGSTQGIVTAINFQYIQSLVLLLLVYIAGINTISGALLGGMFFALIKIANPHLPHALQQLILLGTGLGAVSLGRNPNGLASQIASGLANLRDRIAPPGRARALLVTSEVGHVAATD